MTFAKGNQWCCSWHGWLSYCASNGRWVCKDGTYSPSCTCSTTTTRTTTSTYTPTYTTSSYTTSTYTTPTYTTTSNKQTWDRQCQNQYGVNSESSWSQYCVCKKWYVWSSNGKSCITEAQKCREQFGNAAIPWDPWYCVCQNGYTRSLDRKSCISNDSYCKQRYGSHSFVSSLWSCICEAWYELGTNWCVKLAGSCDSYWPNAYITLDNKCACKNWYEWNNNRNYCVASRNNSLYWWKDFRWAKDWLEYINMLLDYEDELDSIDINKVEAAKQYLWNTGSGRPFY